LFPETIVWYYISPGILPKTDDQYLMWIERVVCMVDDVLIYGKAQVEHNRNLTGLSTNTGSRFNPEQ